MRRTVLFGALLGLACGPGKGGTSDTATTGPASTTDGSGSSSASTVGDSTAVDPSLAPTTADSTTGTTSTGEATTGDPGCAMYQPEAIGPGLDVTIRHEGDAPVWVRALDCSGLVDLDIVDPLARDLFTPAGNCSPTQCHEFVELAACEPACDNCAVPLAVRIEPGASIPVHWPGGFLASMMLTAECAPGEGCQGSCGRPTAAPPGPYSAELRTFHTCTGACECDPTPNGWCPIFEPVGLEDVTLPFTAFKRPGETAIDLVLAAP